MDFLQLQISNRIEYLQMIDDEFRYCVARLHRQLLSAQQEQRLDRYLLAFFQTIDKQSAAFTQRFGVEASSGALRGMLRLTLNDPTYQSEHPFFPVVRRYLDADPCPVGQDAVSYYFLKLSKPFAEYLLNSYSRELEKRNKESGNDGAFEAAESELRGCLPSSDFQELESVLAKRFLLDSPANVLLQVLAEECAACYLTAPEEGPAALNSGLLYE